VTASAPLNAGLVAAGAAETEYGDKHIAAVACTRGEELNYFVVE
jgi:hypothetical protein